MHCRSTSIANLLAEIVHIGIFSQLLVCATSLAVYMVAIESSDNLSVSLMISITGITGNVLITYIYCFLSEHLSHKLNLIGDYYYNCAWYRLPVKQRILIILPIQRAQAEFCIKGFGIVDCSMIVFQRV